MAADIDRAMSRASRGWSRRAPLPTPRDFLGAVAGPDGRIYAIGGARRTMLATVEAYDPVSDRWSKVAPMRVARRGLGVALGPDGRIYAIGGFGSETSTEAGGVTQVEAYDPAADRWEMVAPMATLALNHIAAATGLEGRIYALAASTGTGQPNIMESYDAASDRWTPLPPPAANYQEILTVGAGDGCIYTLGAEGGAVEAYDPRSGAWRSVSPRRHSLRFFGAAVGGDGRIYAMGGTDLRPVASAEAYNLADDTWVDVEPMPEPRSFMALAAGPDGAIYAIGGGDLDAAYRSVHSSTTDVYFP